MSGSYTNPVYLRNFPDPFVLRFNGRYYAFGTGPADDGRMFPLLSSRNLVDWQPHGGALAPLELTGAEEYWAPEVAYHEGLFYLYYATGRSADPDHHLRVAVAEHPLGPWRDSGVNLTPGEIFAIDAHPFRDPRDGQWYLFYANDELEPPYAGTGIVVDRLLTMDRLEGAPRRVLRPYADWQVFELHRPVKHGLDWYTIEGAFTVEVEGRYVCFYSGGRWENPNYGVGYAVADHPLGPWDDAANRAGPQVLRTIPGQVVGPGHNSVVVGPNLLESYLVYHGWDPACTARYPRIDRLHWEGTRPVCDGPSSGPRPMPEMPDVGCWFDEAEPGKEWGGADNWIRDDRGLCPAGSTARLTLREAFDDFVAEIGVAPGPAAGVSVGETEIRLAGGNLAAGGEAVPLPNDFRSEAWHRLILRRSGGSLTAILDDHLTLTLEVARGAAAVALWGDPGASFAHAVVTRR